MELLIISALPILALIVFQGRLAPEIRKMCIILSIPFIVIIAFYSILIFLALIATYLAFSYFMRKLANNQTSTWIKKP